MPRGRRTALVDRKRSLRSRVKAGKDDQSSMTASQMNQVIKMAKKMKPHKQSIMTEWKLSERDAWKNGFYLHTYAVNFNKAITNLSLYDKMNALFESQFTAINKRYKTIKKSVKPNNADKLAKDYLEKGNESIRMFMKIKDACAKLAAIDKKLHSDDRTSGITINAEERQKIINETKRYYQNNSNIEELINKIEKWDDEQFRLAIMIGGTLEGRLAKNYKSDEGASNLKTLLYIQDLINHVNKNLQSSKDRYKNAVQSLDFFDKISKMDFSAWRSAYQLSLSIGLAFEEVFGYAVNVDNIWRASVVGDINDTKTATDVNILFKDLTKAEDSIGVSLKTSSLIYRNQKLDEDIIQDAELLNQIRYFLANYTLIMTNQRYGQKEYRPKDENGKEGKNVLFKDSPLLSFNEVTRIYSLICSQLNKIYLTNMIVGFIMNNWDKDSLDTLPKLIQYRNTVLFTYDILDKLDHTKDFVAMDKYHILLDVTNSLESEYYTFNGAKKRRTKNKDTIVSYDTLINSLPKHYNSLSEQVRSSKVNTAIDLAILMNT